MRPTVPARVRARTGAPSARPPARLRSRPPPQGRHPPGAPCAPAVPRRRWTAPLPRPVQEATALSVVDGFPTRDTVLHATPSTGYSPGMSPVRVGSLVRVLARQIHPELESEFPERAALQRWQMGRVFRVTQISPAGHVGVAGEDIDGNPQPSSLHPGFFDPSRVHAASEAELRAALVRGDQMLAQRKVSEALVCTATNVTAALALGIPSLVFEAQRQAGWALDFGFQLEGAASAFEAALAEEPRLPRDAHHDGLAFDTRLQHLSVLRRLPGVDPAQLLGAMQATLVRTLSSPQRARALVGLALYLDERGDRQGATVAARDIAGLLSDMQPEQRVWPGCIAARTLRRGGLAEGALQLLDTLQPVSGREQLRVHHERGHALLALGRLVEAAVSAEAALELAMLSGADARIAALGLRVEVALAERDPASARAFASIELDLVRAEGAGGRTLLAALLDMADAWIAAGEPDTATAALDEALGIAIGLDKTTGGVANALDVQRRRDAQILAGG